MEKKKLWFRAKSYGWGWTPVTWQGWVITGLYIGVLATIFFWLDGRSHSGSDTLISFFLPFFCFTILFIAICTAKGEKASWHWGDDERSNTL